MNDVSELTPDRPQEEEITHKLTRDVGKRVRAARSRRGLTRKYLAHHSNVSERYLARVEGGDANISLVLLSRIALALDISLLSLLPSDARECIKYEPLAKLINTLDDVGQKRAFELLNAEFSEIKPPRTGVALIGLRGAGKSTLGALLAQKYKVPFVRLDHEISRMAGLDMGELISLTGQQVYRRYEREALRKTLNDYRRVVVETGGSLVSEPDTYDLLRENYFTVWIRALPEDHLDRVRSQGDTRPMDGSRQPMKELHSILDERSQDYQLADHELMTSKRDIADCIDELTRVTKSYLEPQARNDASAV